MNILIAGGGGFIGTFLYRSFLDHGDAVTILTRSAGTPDPDSKVRRVIWDGKTVGPWIDALDGSDAVINVAGESISGNRWTKARKELILSSRIEPTEAIVSAFRKAKKKPGVLVNASGAGFYGSVEEVTESHPGGSDFLAHVCRQWEESAKRAEQEGVRVVLLRSAIVLDRRGGALPRMMLPFRFFAGGVIGSGRQWLPWIHHRDFAAAVRFCITEPSISGPVNVAAPGSVTMREFAETLGRVMRRPAWVPVPSFALRAVLGEMAEMLLTGQRMVPEVLKKHGFAFAYPELESTLEDFIS